MTKKYSELLSGPFKPNDETTAYETQDIAQVRLAKEFPFPSTCSAAVRSYFIRAFDKAALTLVLDQNHNEVISFGLKALSPKKDGNSWYVDFQVDSAPWISAQNEFKPLLMEDRSAPKPAAKP